MFAPSRKKSEKKSVSKLSEKCFSNKAGGLTQEKLSQNNEKSN